ncbi:MAG: hypothetical protein ACTSRI_16150 [Promethearchaeota archaeon]
MRSKDITRNKENLLYSEWVPIGKFVKMIIFLFLVLITFILISISALEPHVMLPLLAILGGTCIFILLVCWNYRGLQITLMKNQIEVNYGIFNHKIIPLKKILSCEITKATFRKYGGVGIRLSFDGSMAYNTDFGEAVKITYQNGRPFVFSTKNPQKICNLINEYSK